MNLFLLVLFLLIFIFSHLAFGSAHPQTAFFVQGCISLILALFLLQQARTTGKTEMRYLPFLPALIGFALIVLYIVLQPLLIKNPPLNTYPFDDTFTQALSCFFIFWLLSLFFQSRTLRLQHYHIFIVSFGALLSLIALAHWLSDNGKLFGLFSSHYISITSRARWPFVNPNHLAVALLYPITITFALLRLEMSHAQQKLKRHRLNKSFTYSHYLSSPSGQKSLTRIAFYFTPFLLSLVTLMATQSRNGFISLLIIVVCSVLFEYLDEQKEKSLSTSRKKEKIIDIHELEHSTAPPRKKPLSLFKIFAFPVLALSLLTFFFLLSPQAARLLDDRLQYGIAETSSDIRKTLYTDSYQLFKDAPWFGIGSGQWKERFPQVQSREVQPHRPIYLHSDPWQYLIEFGLIGFTITLVSLLYVGIALAMRYSGLTPQNKHIFRYSALGILLFVIFSFFDFPFHIFALRLGFFTYLAALCFLAQEPQEAIIPFRESNSQSQ